MSRKEIALKINIIVLALAGGMDIIRGFMHTFQVREAAINHAKIDPIPDSLFLMGAFGISNFLTAFIYFLVIWKARTLAPFILLTIPICYFIGGIGRKFQNVVPESEFTGQYMMSFYLCICALTAIFYFIFARNKQTVQIPEVAHNS